MLRLSKAYVGSPNDILCTLNLQARSLLVYTSGDTVVLLNARTLQLERILGFWEVYPSTYDTFQHISSIVIDSGLKLIAVASGSKLAFWYPSGKDESTWRVHSSLAIEEDISCFDCRSGLIAAASKKKIFIYSLSLQGDIPTWTIKLSQKFSGAERIAFSPSLSHIAVLKGSENTVYILPTVTIKHPQIIRHPRHIEKLNWRAPKSSNRADLVLYTLTSDSTLRIFTPVLDSPNHLQLHTALDIASFIPFSFRKSTDTPTGVFWLNRLIIQDMLSFVLDGKSAEDGIHRKLEDLRDGDWDLFAKVTHDRTLVIRAVENLDSRPPTLLRQFTLLQLPNFPSSPPLHWALTPFTTPEGKHHLTLSTFPPLTSLELVPHLFFDGQSAGLTTLNSFDGADQQTNETSKIKGFVRTPDGKGLAVKRHDGVQICSTDGRTLTSQLSGPTADQVVVLRGGLAYITYSPSSKTLTLFTVEAPTPSTSTVPSLVSLFALPAKGGETAVIAVTADTSLLRFEAKENQLEMITEYKLPLSETPSLVLPVDPMAWSSYPEGTGHDVLLCASHRGELSFWKPEGHQWICSGRVHTGREDIRLARCSSAKKTVLVTKSSSGADAISIWDSKESEFSTGLEYEQIFDSEEQINDLDWTSTFDSHSILAVGFPHKVLLLCQQRMTYFDQEPAWSVCYTIDISNTVPSPISDSIWLTNGSFLVGAGHQMLLHTRPGISGARDDRVDLFDHVAIQNAPLPDYHPQMLLQCLLWGKIELVKDIIVRLSKGMDKLESSDSRFSYYPLDVTEFLQVSHKGDHRKPGQSRSKSVWGPSIQVIDEEEDSFSRSLVTSLIEKLEKDSPLDLSPNELAHLLILIQTVLEIDEQRRALDDNGLRYLISLRSFHILNRRASPNGNALNPPTRTLVARERMRYRDIVWAYHSESENLLLDAAVSSTGRKVTWADARALGLFMWITSHECLRAQMEDIARNQYLAGDNRDPTACSLFYFALGKIKLVQGLWKQAAWHKEQAVMLRFLSNDFNEPRWRTAAMKNAYALLAKQRWEYAAAFFLLGGSLRDAVNVCLKQLNDFQLAIALARVVERSDEGPIFQDILSTFVVPLAFKEGNRWLASWAFWIMRRRDFAVRVLITPLKDLAPALDARILEIGDPHYDDPSLALLFSQLKSKSLQTMKGASEISGRTETRFVMQIVRVFCRMGCYVLALNLVKSWTFEEPAIVSASPMPPSVQPNGKILVAPSPSRPTFSFHHARRRSSILIDMDIPSLPPTEPVSPSSDRKPSPIPEVVEPKEGDARRTELGSLIRSARKDVKVPEFDMSNFYSPANSPPVASPLRATQSPANNIVPQEKPKGMGTFMKATTNVQVPEFDMNSFF